MIALAMLDASKIEDQDVQNGFHPAEIIQHAVNRWFSEITKDLRYLDPVISLSDSSAPFVGCEEEGRENSAAIGLAFKRMSGFLLGNKLTAIEQAVPGLGETAIHTLSRLLTTFSTSVMPDDILMSAQYLYWAGCEIGRASCRERV